MPEYSDKFLITFFKLTSRFDKPNLKSAHKHLSSKFASEMKIISVDELGILHSIRSEFGDDQAAVEFIRKRKESDVLDELDVQHASEIVEKDHAKTKRQKELQAEDIKRQQWLANPNMQISGYKLAGAKTKAELQQIVNAHIKDRWFPWGGAGFAALGMSPMGGNQYFQALVKFRTVESRSPSGGTK